jgi:hypothetical protein
MRSWKLLLPLLASTLCFAAQPDRITGTINSSQMVALPGHTNRRALPQYDRGPVEASFQLNQVTLLTLPTPSQRKALNLLLAEQQDPKSPSYHKWLTPEQYADSFGLSENDVQRISGWLKSQGLTVVSVARGRNWIVFSGTAAQVAKAFRTEIHRFNVNGESHFANTTPPSIPLALSGIASGIRGLDDFRPKPAYVKAAPRKKGARPDYYDANFPIADFVAPGDVATIYDINALYTGGFTGAGQKLVIVGQTDVYLADLNAFRTGFGLPLISGCTTDPTTTQITACNSSNFKYVLDGTDPGVATPAEGDLTEADLDLEWSAATARGAQIIFVNSTNVFTSYYYAIDNQLAPVISMSYGACEFDDNDIETSTGQPGPDEIELMKSNSEGITFMNSSGDNGVAECDPPQPPATDPNNLATGGLAVSYPASSPEVTGVGGTAISYPNGFTSTYWGTGSGATTNGGTAQNPPLPETSWNDDVELGLAFPSDFGSPLSVQESSGIISSGGGASNCSVQTSDNLNCSSGFPQPSWQTVTVPGQANARFSPDVSLMASPNFPGYIYCTPVEELSSASPYDTETTSSCGTGTASDIAAAVNGVCSGTCNGSNRVVSPSIVGGTSASSPIFAGIVTLLNQYLSSTGGLGNINSKLYYLAENPSNGAFHQVTSGNNIVYCEAGQPAAPWPTALQCPSSGSFGYDASNADATTGYNLVTGLGSVDANVLAAAWTESLIATSTSISPSTNSTVQGAPVTFTATVTPPTATGVVNFYDNSSTTALGSATLSSGTAALTTTSLPGGSNSVVGSYVGINGGSSSSAVNVSVTPSDFTLQTTSPLAPASVSAGQSAIAVLTLTLVQGLSETINFTNSSGSPTSSTPGSCTAGLPAGALCSFQNLSNPSTPTSVTLTSTNPSATMQVTITTAANMALPTGAQPITITGTPSGNGTTSHTASVSLTVTTTQEAFTIAPQNQTYPVTAGGAASVNITVSNATGGTPSFINSSTNPPTTALPLTYTCAQSSLPSEASCSFNPTNGNSVSATSVTLNITTSAPTGQLRPPLGRGSRIFYALLLPGLFGMVFLGGSRMRGARLLSLILVLGFSTLWLSACGGSSNSSQKNPGTPAGSYSVVVNATTAAPTGGTALTGTFKVTIAVTN